jgi:hypothetical protein
MLAVMTVLGFCSTAEAQTEFTVNMHFPPTFNYHANVNSANVTYYVSMNNGADINLFRSELLAKGGVMSVLVNPHTATQYAVNITFKHPQNIDQLWDIFFQSRVIFFYCPEGQFHMKDWKGWMIDHTL